jgi:hypothetical protein
VKEATPVSIPPHLDRAPGHSIGLQCTGCQRVLPEAEFAWKRRADGLRHKRCRSCQAATGRAHYERNAEEYKSRAQARDAPARRDARAGLTGLLATHPCVVCGASVNDHRKVDHLRGRR